mmetsp:Transcript_42181/g.61854  ORF Transcript_42181/g.61854 Transcript_42181/m.61854 type:complete len:220 (+) Transcript_42181:499-1158(+)
MLGQHTLLRVSQSSGKLLPDGILTINGHLNPTISQCKQSIHQEERRFNFFLCSLTVGVDNWNFELNAQILGIVVGKDYNTQHPLRNGFHDGKRRFIVLPHEHGRFDHFLLVLEGTVIQKAPYEIGIVGLLTFRRFSTGDLEEFLSMTIGIEHLQTNGPSDQILRATLKMLREEFFGAVTLARNGLVQTSIRSAVIGGRLCSTSGVRTSIRLESCFGKAG